VTVRTTRNARDAVQAERFVLEAIDDETECVTSEIGFDVDDTAELYRLIGASAAEFDARGQCELQQSEIGQLVARYKLAFAPATRLVRIRHRCPLDDLPYTIHTGRELVLMLEGSKPLAYFCDWCPPNSSVEVIPERLFDAQVAKGRFVKREFLTSTFGRCNRIVMYALPQQEWRVDAMMLLLETSAKSGWNEGFERMQGALLGYEDWQNDIFIERIYRPAQKDRG
jgi:hypothetical protein